MKARKERHVAQALKPALPCAVGAPRQPSGVGGLMRGLGPYAASKAFACAGRHLQRAAAAYREGWQEHRAAVDALRVALAVMEAALARGELTPRLARRLSAFTAAGEGSLLAEVSMDDAMLQELEGEARGLEELARAARKLTKVLRSQLGGGA